VLLAAKIDDQGGTGRPRADHHASCAGSTLGSREIAEAKVQGLQAATYSLRGEVTDLWRRPHVNYSTLRKSPDNLQGNSWPSTARLQALACDPRVVSVVLFGTSLRESGSSASRSRFCEDNDNGSNRVITAAHQPPLSARPSVRRLTHS
jgi:hypothetical protein